MIRVSTGATTWPRTNRTEGRRFYGHTGKLRLIERRSGSLAASKSRLGKAFMPFRVFMPFRILLCGKNELPTGLVLSHHFDPPFAFRL